MVKKGKNKSCCEATDKMGCCQVESLISVDERGQMVLPKEIRDKAKIKPGDKFAVISWKKDGEICCISLVSAGELGQMVKSLLGPMAKEILQK
jgi:AbrB family looped-hinge helix DNA binding protein